MGDVFNHDRRSFIKSAGAVALGAAAGNWSFRAGAELAPARIRIGHIADTFLGVEDNPDKSGMIHPGWLYGHSYAISRDILDQFKESGPENVNLVVHGGRIARNWKSACNAFEWVNTFNLPFEHTSGCFYGSPGFAYCETSEDEEMEQYRSYEFGGFLFCHLDVMGLIITSKRSFKYLNYLGEQLDMLKKDLSDHSPEPAVLVMHPPLYPPPVSPGLALAESHREALIDVIKSRPQVLAVLCGKALSNYSYFIPGCSAVCIGTSSPVIYPCGARLVDIEVKEGGEVTIASRFIQTRLLTLVEKSFHQAGPPKLLEHLGSREDRTFVAVPGTREIKRIVEPLGPNLAPFWKGADSVSLAVLSDTHLCLDELMPEGQDTDNALIGHYNEEGSIAVFEDALDQVVTGRQRIEFYDEAFASDPDDERHYIDFEADGLLITGDLCEHGYIEESKLVRNRLDSLPSRLRGRTWVTPGNHDMYIDFAPDGEQSSKRHVAEFYKGYGPKDGKTNFVVALTEWASLIVMDTSIPGQTPLGMIQDRIDWVEDMLDQLSDQAVLVASHHTPYKLTLVPELMVAYLRTRSHFTPKRSAARLLLQDIFAKHDNVKMVLSGHYHGMVVDQFKKQNPKGEAADDGVTTHVQVPCTVEYPIAYRLLKLRRHGNRGAIEYFTCYSRLHDLREKSRQASLYKVLGTEARVPRKYEGTMERLKEKDNIFGDAAMLGPYDLFDLNVRGFKDGTARGGKGKGGKPNQNGKIEFTI